MPLLGIQYQAWGRQTPTPWYSVLQQQHGIPAAALHGNSLHPATLSSYLRGSWSAQQQPAEGAGAKAWVSAAPAAAAALPAYRAPAPPCTAQVPAHIRLGSARQGQGQSGTQHALRLNPTPCILNPV